MQIKTTVKYYFISTRMTLNKIGITDVGEDVEKLEHLCTLGTNLNLDSCLVKQYSSFFQKIINMIYQFHCLKKYLYILISVKLFTIAKSVECI